MNTDPIAQKRATRFVLMAVFVSATGFGIIIPSLPHLIIELLGAGTSLSDATRIGAWVGATYAICQFLLGPLMGNLGDRFGRRPVFLISLFGFAIDFVMMGLAPSIIWLFIGRAIAGGLGAIFGPANAAMADISTAENRAASFGKVGAAFGLGFIFGPAMGGLLADMSARLPFFVAGGLAMTTFIYGYFAFPETMSKDKRRPFAWSRANPLGALISLGRVPSVLPIALIYFLWVTAVNIYPASWSYYAPAQFGWSPKMVGLSLTIVGLSMVFFQSVVIGRMVKRFGERKTAQMGAAYGVCLFLIYAFMTNGMVALFFALFNGLQGMAMPAINAMMSRRVPPNQQGELQGLNGSMAALSILVAQLVYNYTLSYFTSAAVAVHFAGAPFLIAAGFAAFALIALFLLPKAQAETKTE